MIKKSSTQNTLQELRKRAGISQRKLAAKADVDRAQIVNAESGAKTISLDVAMKSARVLGEIDGVRLYIEQNTYAIKSRVEAGEEGPGRALTLLQSLARLLTKGNMSTAQQNAARAAVKELLALVEGNMPDGSPRTIDAATKSGTASGATEEDTNLFLGRSASGRALSDREAGQRREDSAAGVWKELGTDDPNMDADGPPIDQDELGRDDYGNVRRSG